MDKIRPLKPEDKEKFRRIGKWSLILTLCLCSLGTDYIAVQVWHWPVWFAYTAGPILAALAWLGLAFGLIFAFLGLLEVFHKTSGSKV